MMSVSRNDALFSRAQSTIPGGVNSPVRAFKAVGGTPRFFARGAGPFFWDADGKRYIDYVGSWGPLILGHAHPDIVRTVAERAQHGLSFGAPTEIEIELAELLCASVPGMEMVRLVSSGTEATMTALRLARGFTGRSRIIKFEGCYHGHADPLLVKAGSGMLTLGQPSSGGVPPETAGHTTVLSFNDCAQLAETFAKMGHEIAAVIVEPIAGNMNFVPGAPEFLGLLRELCTKHGTVLIFDEVMTGFRVGPQGAQGVYGITADIVTLGKVIGGGMPVGAFGGRRDVMSRIAPLGPVYQAGTLSGNPVAVAAGLETLKRVLAPGFFEALGAQTKRLTDGLAAAGRRAGVQFSAASVGGMFGIFFRAEAPASYAEVMQSDKEAFNRFFHAALMSGVYFAPSAFEAGFVSAAHTAAEIDETVRVAEEIFRSMAR
jgi:glutamate-1-semialdehyde 2,1-aminomutase